MAVIKEVKITYKNNRFSSCTVRYSPIRIVTYHKIPSTVALWIMGKYQGDIIEEYGVNTFVTDVYKVV